MDPFTMAAEIATILQAAEGTSSLGHRRASRKERREAYLAYQHEVYRLMAGINHLSFLAQIETTSWRTVGAALIAMTGSLIDLINPEEPCKHSFTRNLQDTAKGIKLITETASPGAWHVVANAHTSDNQLRDRIIVDIAAVRDITADFLAALNKVRLVGRPGPVACADVLLTLLLELIRRVPLQGNRPLSVRIWSKLGKARDDRADAFGNCLTAIGEANGQFISAVRADHLSRRRSWQVSRRRASEIRPARELLDDVVTVADDSGPKRSLDSGPSS